MKNRMRFPSTSKQVQLCRTKTSIVCQFYHDRKLNWCRKPDYPEGITTCCKSLTNFFTRHCIEYISSAGFEDTTLVVIGADGIGSYKSTYHSITIRTIPNALESDIDGKCIHTMKIYKVYTI